MLLLLCCHAPALGQDYVSFFRGDEIGPRTFKLDEDTLMDVLSQQQPIESLQPWLTSENGIYSNVGSLSRWALWVDQQVKYNGSISDWFRINAHFVQQVDFDSEYMFIQTTPEVQLSKRLEFFAPFNLWFDKGDMDVGLGLRLRDREQGIDYVQLSIMRSDFMIDNRSIEEYPPDVEEWADTYEIQAQIEPGNFGKSTLKVSYLPGMQYDYTVDGKSERYQRFELKFLHNYDLSPRHRFFFIYDQHNVEEHVDSYSVETAEEAFIGDRDYFSGRLEYHYLMDEEMVRRIRVGFNFIYFDEWQEEPGNPEDDQRNRRREGIFYGAYRLPLTDDNKLTLELNMFLDWMSNTYHFPNYPAAEDHDPPFQGKVGTYFQWDFAENAQFVLNPTFELEGFDWAGGGIQLRYKF